MQIYNTNNSKCSKFAVGDEVVVKRSLRAASYNGLSFPAEMREFCGQTATIVGYNFSGNYILSISDRWVFNDRMLDGVECYKKLNYDNIVSDEDIESFFI